MREYFTECLKKLIYRNRSTDYADEIMDKLSGILKDIVPFSKEANEELAKIVDVLGPQLCDVMHEVIQRDTPGSVDSKN